MCEGNNGLTGFHRTAVVNSQEHLYNGVHTIDALLCILELSAVWVAAFAVLGACSGLVFLYLC